MYLFKPPDPTNTAGQDTRRLSTHCAARVPYSVVIADPCRRSVSALRQACQERAFEVQTCTDGRQLRQLALKRHIDLVVAELRLADGPSLKHLAWLKERGNAPHLVVVTHHASIATAVRCAKLHVEGYLEKPASLDEILEAARGEREFDETVLGQPLSLNRALWEYVNHAIESGGSISGGAELLGLDRRSLRRMIAKYAPPIAQSR